MNKQKSLKNKLWTYFMLFTLLIFGMLWILQTIFLQAFYDKMLENKVRKVAESIIQVEGTTELESTIDKLSYENSLLIFITDKSGNPIYSSDSYKSYYNNDYYSSDNTSNPYLEGENLNYMQGQYRNLPDGYDEFLEQITSSENGSVSIATDSKYIYGSYISLPEHDNCVLYISTSLGSVSAATSIIRMQLIFVTIISILLGFFISYFISKKFAAPLYDMSVNTTMLGTDGYNKNLGEGFCKEMDSLSSSLDEANDNLINAQNYRRDLLANVSHDLRTPMTVIKGYCEMLRDVSWNDEEQRSKDIDIIINESDKVTNLINKIFEKMN